MSLFNKGSKAVTDAVDIVTDTVDEMTTMDMPLVTLPDSTGEHPASIGDDVNLPLLVRELGGRKKLKLSRRREQILKELDTIDKELMQLDVLLDAANSL